MCAATEKFTKRSTAETTVKPMAGTASTAPAMRPFRESWRSFSKLSHLYFDQLPILHLRGAECDLDDVAVIGEFARSRSARILDLLALRDQLEPVERVVDHDA